MPFPLQYARAAVIIAFLTATPALAQQRAALRAAITRAGLAPVRASHHTLGTNGAVPALGRPSEAARFGLELLAASAGAIGGGIGGYAMLRDLSETRVKGDEGYTRSGNVGYLVGSFAGATLGAHLAGRRLGGTSPLWATSLGALAGTAPLIALGVDEPYLPLLGIVLGWIPQGALAAAGYTLGDQR